MGCSCPPHTHHHHHQGELGGALRAILLLLAEPALLIPQADMQRWEEQSQGAIYTVEYACRYLPRLAHCYQRWCLPSLSVGDCLKREP